MDVTERQAVRRAKALKRRGGPSIQLFAVAATAISKRLDDFFEKPSLSLLPSLLLLLVRLHLFLVPPLQRQLDQVLDVVVDAVGHGWVLKVRNAKLFARL